MQSNSATLLWENIADIYRRNFADTIHLQHRHIGRYISVCRYIGRAPFIILLDKLIFSCCPCSYFRKVLFYLQQGRSQTFSFGGATGGASFATRGAVNGLCRTFRKRPEKFWGARQNFGEAVPPPGTPPSSVPDLQP